MVLLGVSFFLFDLNLPTRSRRHVRWKVKMQERCREREENVQFKFPIINLSANCLKTLFFHCSEEQSFTEQKE